MKRLLKKNGFIRMVSDLCGGGLVLIEPGGTTLYDSEERMPGT